MSYQHGKVIPREEFDKVQAKEKKTDDVEVMERELCIESIF